VLGLATETNKLDVRERTEILQWTAEALHGRLPLAVTVAEPSVHGQIAFVRTAKEAGRRLGDPAAAAARRLW
jgi:dihydrodipicolinate synthase/N-acetylneuraminate lyase